MTTYPTDKSVAGTGSLDSELETLRTQFNNLVETVRQGFAQIDTKSTTTLAASLLASTATAVTPIAKIGLLIG